MAVCVGVGIDVRVGAVIGVIVGVDGDVRSKPTT